MRQINKNAIISITKGNATGFSRIRFNIPEEMKFTFPINELFKMDVVGFDIKKIDFKEEQGKHLVLLITEVVRSKMLSAVFSFAVHWETYDALKLLIKKETYTPDEEEALINGVKKLIQSYPPIIQIIPKITQQ